MAGRKQEHGTYWLDGKIWRARSTNHQDHDPNKVGYLLQCEQGMCQRWNEQEQGPG